MKRFYSTFRTVSLGIALMLTALCASAQNLTVTGVVSDQNGPLAGVAVIEKGTTNGSISNENGSYSISVKSPDAQLEYSYLGYISQLLPINNNSIVNVTLEQDQLNLDEVVVVGYGSSRRRDLTGSIATLNAGAINGQTVQNAAQAMQGKIAGVQITNTGEPGGSPQVRIRGLATVSGGADPLYVVDGVIVNNISYLGPNDIENMSVLKDASAAAIYGVRAAGGVILVTTKQGRTDGKPVVSVNVYGGYKTPSHLAKAANGAEYVQLYNEKMELMGESKRLNAANFDSYDYVDHMLQSSWSNSEDISVTGGSKNSRYSFGVHHLQDDGLIRHNNFERIGFRSKIDVDINKNIRTGLSVVVESTKSNPMSSGLLMGAFTALPLYNPRNANGTWTDPSRDDVAGAMGNPAASLFYDKYNWRNALDAIINGYVEVDFLKDFTIKTNLGVNPNSGSSVRYTPIHNVSAFQNANKNSMSKSRTQNVNVYWDNTLTYSKTIANDHHLKVMIGTSYQSSTTDWLSASVEGLKDLPKISQSFLYLSMPRIDGEYSPSVSDDGSKWVSSSYMARITYDYQDKYLFNATMRYDGSTKFPKNNRWGFFPSVGLGWVVSSEEFLKESKTIDFLKLRASWGVIGNSNIPGNIYVPSINKDGYNAIIFGPDQNTGSGTVMYPGTITDMYNPNLQWETVSEFNVGVDMRMLSNRLSITTDVYSRTTTNAIFPLTNLGSTGLNAGGVWGNNAKINNTGVELTLGWAEQRGDFSYAVNGNFTYNRNKLVSINATGSNGMYGRFDDSANLTYSTIGQPVGQFFGYKVIGVYQNADDIARYPGLPGVIPGDLIFANTNGDEVLDERDRTFLGDPNPPVFYGFDASLGYKNWDFNIAFQGVAGNDIFNSNRLFRYGSENWDKDFAKNRWHGEGTSNSYPSAKTSNATVPNSFYVEKGGYMRVKSIQLGYSLPKNALKKVGISQLRFYVNAENPFTFTNYTGFSPEVGGAPLMSGVDRGVYPLSSVYSVGANLTF